MSLIREIEEALNRNDIKEAMHLAQRATDDEYAQYALIRCLYDGSQANPPLEDALDCLRSMKEI